VRGQGRCAGFSAGGDGEKIAEAVNMELAGNLDHGVGPGRRGCEFPISIVIPREDVRPHSRGAMRPSFASIAALDNNKRAQGKPGARCTRGLACNSA